MKRPADASFSVIGIPGRAGKLLLCPCPGRWQAGDGDGAGEAVSWDLRALAAAGATSVLSLVEANELPGGHEAYAAAVAAAQMNWAHLPIPDFGTPDAEFEHGWRKLGLLDRLAAGEDWAVHCRAGLGRTGLVASRLLMEAGARPQEAIARIRAEHAAGAVETQAQNDYLFGLARNGAGT